MEKVQVTLIAANIPGDPVLDKLSVAYDFGPPVREGIYKGYINTRPRPGSLDFNKLLAWLNKIPNMQSPFHPWKLTGKGVLATRGGTASARYALYLGANFIQVHIVPEG